MSPPNPAIAPQKPRQTWMPPILAAAWLLACPDAEAANQSSATYHVTADVFCRDMPALAVGSARFQQSLSVGQRAPVGKQSGASFQVEAGYQATTEGFDTDADRIPDNADQDDDRDGLADAADGRPYDTDNDGLNNLGQDADDDNDSFADWVERLVTATDPLDPADFLALLNASRTGSQIVASWRSVAGNNRYWLHRSVSVTNPVWQPVAGPVTATGRVATATDTNPPVGRAFYRIAIPY